MCVCWGGRGGQGDLPAAGRQLPELSPVEQAGLADVELGEDALQLHRPAKRLPAKRLRAVHWCAPTRGCHCAPILNFIIVSKRCAGGTRATLPRHEAGPH